MQVKSSQVKSSQVKSSQVKSSNIIFSLFLLLLLFSCADISNYKKDISFAFAPNFLASRASFPFLEDNTEVLCVAKLYTHGTNVDVLTQERTFRGTWSDLVNNHEFRFEDANVWCKGYVKVTVSYSYVEDSTGISEQKTVVLQGKSDTSSFIRGNLLLTVELENAPSTKIVLFKSDKTIKLAEEKSLRDDMDTNTGTEHQHMGNNIESTRFAFDQDGTLFTITLNSSSPPKTIVTGFPKGIECNDAVAIKCDGSNVWALCSNGKFVYVKNLENIGSGETSYILDGVSESNIFAVKYPYVYIPVAMKSGGGDYPNYAIKRYSLSAGSGSEGSARESGSIDVSRQILGLAQNTSNYIFDMHIQQGRLYLIVNDVEFGGSRAERSRGGIVQIPLSDFDNEKSISPWSNGQIVLGLYNGNRPSKNDKNHFFGPVRFLARKPDELVIADDGWYRENDRSEGSKKRVVFLDLDTLSMRSVECSTTSASGIFFLGMWNSSHYLDGYERY